MTSFLKKCEELIAAGFICSACGCGRGHNTQTDPNKKPKFLHVRLVLLDPARGEQARNVAMRCTFCHPDKPEKKTKKRCEFTKSLF